MGLVAFDDAALQVTVHKSVSVNVKESIGKEMPSMSLCTALAKSLITPAANSVVKATLKESLHKSIEATTSASMTTSEAKCRKEYSDAMKPHVERATKACST